MIDWQLYGPQAGGHHATNVLLHAATTVLLFLLFWRMTGRVWPSAVVAVLFAIHPLRVESVAWVTERKDVLSGLFFVLTLGAYLNYVRQPFSRKRYLAVAVFFALGLLSKPMLVMLPLVLLLLDYWPLGRFAGDPRSSLTPPVTPRVTPPHCNGGGFLTVAHGLPAQTWPVFARRASPPRKAPLAPPGGHLLRDDRLEPCQRPAADRSPSHVVAHRQRAGLLRGLSASVLLAGRFGSRVPYP